MAVLLEVFGFVDHTHPSDTELRDDFVRAEFCAGGEYYLFSFAVQFGMMDIGSTPSCFDSVLVRNRYPSLLTS